MPNTHIIEMPDLPFKTNYNFSIVQGVQPDLSTLRFVLVGANKLIATEDIMRACKAAKIKLCADDIVFTAEAMATSVNSDFTNLTFCGLTATGKIPTYPLRLYFTTSNDPNRPKSYYTGELFYRKDGAVGKYAINRWRWVSRVEMDRTVYKGKLP
jgi:hypothetical protein